MNFLKSFNLLDYSILALVILLTFLSVFIGNRLKKRSKKETESESFLDLILMGRSLTTPMFVATLVATWYGGIFGTAQIAFESGIYNFVTQGVFWYISYIVFAFFILKRIDTDSPKTLAELIGNMFGPKSQKLSAVFNILNLVPVVYTISLSLLIQMILNTTLIEGSLIGMIIVLAYSLFGGFRAVVFSDIIQFFVMISAVILVAIYSFSTFGIAPLNNLPSSYFSLTGNYSILETLSWGIIAVSTLVDPNFYQRAFAAKNKVVAKKGILISTCFWIVFDLSLTFGAMYARSINPEANSDYAYFQYAFDLLPHGLKGFFLAGIMATVLSTLDSYLFLCGSTFSVDLFKSTKKRYYYFGILLISTLSIILASAFDGNIKSVWKALGSISSSALLIPVMFGIFYPKKIKDNQFIMTSLSAAIVTIFWRLSGFKYQYNLDELYVGCSASILFLSFFAISNKKLVSN